MTSTPRPSPLVGYNTAIQHRGVPYHVQTEDSGVAHPHVITHLFAEGGRILATRKSSYAQHVGTPAYPEVVRQLIREQHKAMIVALRDGAYDGLLVGQSSEPGCPEPAFIPAPVGAGSSPPAAVPQVSGAAPAQEHARRPRRTSLPERELAGDSLDEIIIADLVLHLDE